MISVQTEWGISKIVQRLYRALEKVSNVCTIISLPMNSRLSKKAIFQNSSHRRSFDKNPTEEKEPNMYRQEDAAKRRAPAVGRYAA